MAFSSIGIVGTGAMGRGIAQLFAQSGIAVVMHDTNQAALTAATTYLSKTFETLVTKGKIESGVALQVLQRITTCAELSGLSQCDLIVEAIVENLSVKQKLFQQLEEIVKPNTVLVSNTSSLSITAIAAVCQRPEQVAGLHFFNPVPLMKVVEVIRGVRTNRDSIERLVQLVKGTGHAAVTCNDYPGFIVNHAGRAYGTEALRLLGEGVAHFNSASDEQAYSTIDSVLREQVQFDKNALAIASTKSTTAAPKSDYQGFRLGPFELLDLTALDVSHPVMESIFKQFYEEPRFRPSPITAQRLAGGLLGRKTQQGFYRYVDGQPVKATEAQTNSWSSASLANAVPAQLVWVGPGLARAAVCELVKALGVQVENSARPSLTSLIILLPEGKDCTTEAIECQVAPERSIALDSLFAFGFNACKHRVIMTNPATDLGVVASAVALFGLDGAKVSVLQDSPGFIAPRVIAMIVSIASEIAQQQIASPQDIDKAVKLGLGYPIGPLSMGDQIGPQRVLGILEDMYQVTKDPRYRPGLWLRRRAMLGMSLLSI